MNNTFKIKFNFISLISITALVGFCAGVVSIPILIIQNLGGDSFDVFTIFFYIIGTPLVGLINGAILGLLAYPFYWWLSKKLSFKYKGVLYEVEQKGSSDS